MTRKDIDALLAEVRYKNGVTLATYMMIAIDEWSAAMRRMAAPA